MPGALAGRLADAVGGTALTPPLPLVAELAGLFGFAVDGADDAAEDAVKAVAAVGVWMGTRVASRAAAGVLTPADVRVVGVALALAAYPAVNDVADAAGDAVERWRNAAVTWLQLPFKVTGTVRDAPLVEDAVYAQLAPGGRALVDAARVLDDATEDVFKTLCLAAHWRVGSVLRDHYWFWLTGSAGGRGSRGHALGYVLGVGVPASQYSLCNDYGDMLGDVLQVLLTHPVVGGVTARTGSGPKA
ncbi:uncharacterized protein AMSG_03505 [Thecamonas trahens ATCC 50062]|uniref:Uncharacterized protein n=1 Tax=Thecamonas trahens ATCC 50062 TaxID=461836 RepID=A0A0L0D4C5_THETB|nr:hypothetical protein AMSG_03505 [Thecamonas trahens ATCC 50062]KNC47080.1 hypothetical protein AMSG_03505 [Thecamonas trahens ATCC 50062]|eukprot:XP_013759860.1 hypothetical protein AMSG_03505 [Thecamonas trahens ATCC 50062]